MRKDLLYSLILLFKVEYTTNYKSVLDIFLSLGKWFTYISTVTKMDLIYHSHLIEVKKIILILKKKRKRNCSIWSFSLTFFFYFFKYHYLSFLFLFDFFLLFFSINMWEITKKLCEWKKRKKLKQFYDYIVIYFLYL